MSLLLYAIADAQPEAIAGAGIGDAPLRTVGQPGLVAVLSQRPASPPFGVSAMREYERVIDRLMASHSVLPARFGTVVDDEREAQELLDDRGPDLGAALRFVDGAVELGLRAQWRAQPEIADDSGTSYMRARLAQLHRAREVAAQLEPLEALSRDRRIAVSGRPELAVTAAYLVDRSLCPQFTETVRRLDHDLEDVEIVCTGPWPPYSFAEGATK